MNLKTAEEIKKGLKCCNTYNDCQNCPYDDKVEKGWGCCVQRNADALAYIRQLEAQVPKWISVDDPPKKGGRYLVLFENGQCCDAEYDENVDFDSQFGEWVAIYHPDTLGYLDSEWRGYQEVTHWMPMPGEPKEG